MPAGAGGQVEAALREALLGAGQVSAPGRPFVDALEFVERHLVRLSQEQVAGLALLEALGGQERRYGGLIDAVLRLRSHLGEVGHVIKAIEAVALYDKFAGISASVNRQKQV